MSAREEARALIEKFVAEHETLQEHVIELEAKLAAKELPDFDEKRRRARVDRAVGAMVVTLFDLRQQIDRALVDVSSVLGSSVVKDAEESAVHRENHVLDLLVDTLHELVIVASEVEAGRTDLARKAIENLKCRVEESRRHQQLRTFAKPELSGEMFCRCDHNREDHVYGVGRCQAYECSCESFQFHGRRSEVSR